MGYEGTFIKLDKNILFTSKEPAKHVELLDALLFLMFLRAVRT